MEKNHLNELRSLIRKIINEEEDYIDPIWGFDENDFSGRGDFLVKTITKKLGKQNYGVTGADWGGIINWSIKGNQTVGVFVSLGDDGNVYLDKRTDTDEDLGVKMDNIYIADNIDELNILLDKALKIKNS